MGKDGFTDTHRMTPMGFSMTEEQWREYFKWEDEMKRIHGSRFYTMQRCFGRDPFKDPST